MKNQKQLALRRGGEGAGNRRLGGRRRNDGRTDFGDRAVSKAGREEEQQMIDDGERRVWAEMTDEQLEGRLFTYYWLAMNTPNSHGERFRQLADEMWATPSTRRIFLSDNHRDAVLERLLGARLSCICASTGVSSVRM